MISQCIGVTINYFTRTYERYEINLRNVMLINFNALSTNCVVPFQSSAVNYNVYSTFQSHEPEFDYLKSLEIEEKINQIKWVHRKNNSHFLLSTNGTGDICIDLLCITDNLLISSGCYPMRACLIVDECYNSFLQHFVVFMFLYSLSC